MNINTKEKQHTVPRFILRNFAVKNKLYSYDKYTGKIYKSSVNDSGCERGFYDFEIKIDSHIIQDSIEAKLCEIEGFASHVVKKILENDTVTDLTDAEKDNMVYFLAAQMMRTHNVKYNFKSMPGLLRNKIKNRMPKLANDPNIEAQFPDFDEDSLNMHFDMLIAESTERLKPYFKELEWILVRTDENNPFIMGDSPVVIFNELYHDKKESFNFSKYALVYKGSCVFFPLSPTRALWLVDPGVIEKYENLTKEMHGMLFLSLIAGIELKKPWKEMQSMLDRRNGFKKTKIIDFSSKEVKRFNYFEISHAERKVFSKFSNFEQVEELIKKDESYRHGMRTTCC